MCILNTYEHKKHFYLVNTCRKPGWSPNKAKYYLQMGEKLRYKHMKMKKGGNMLISYLRIIFQPSFCTVFIKYAKSYLMDHCFSINPWGEEALEAGPLELF